MHEIGAPRKNKIVLSDYNSKRDIENRLLMSLFTQLDLDVLEAIIYSSITIPVKKLAKSVDGDPVEILEALNKLSKTGLLTFDNETVSVDKEMRKYFETEIEKFDEDFEPSMEFFEALLHKVPMNVQVIWYAIPRTATNIFESLLERVLLTPQIYQRYLSELSNSDPLLFQIVEKVQSSPDLEVPVKELMETHKLNREQFEEVVLQLEFNLACSTRYRKVKNKWEEVVVPFREWREYLTFLHATRPTPIGTPSKIVHDSKPASPKRSVEERGQFLQTHSKDGPVWNEKNVREVEKALDTVIDLDWVLFDDFLKSLTVPLSERSVIALKRIGKTWKYPLPEYSDEEIAFIKAVLFEWLPDIGAVTTGRLSGRECFSLTPFGQSFFGR
jgi:predicted transcriptional regulator